MSPKRLQLLLLTALFLGEAVGSCLHETRLLRSNAFVLHGMGMLGIPFGEALRILLLYPMLWLLLFCVMGLTVSALPGAAAMICLHGMTLGAVLRELYQGHVLAGLAKAVCFVMPYVTVQTLLLLLAARESLRSSFALSGTLHSRAGERCSLSRQGLRYLILGLGIILSGIVQAFWSGDIYPIVQHWLVRG